MSDHTARSSARRPDPHEALDEWQDTVTRLSDGRTRVCRECVPDDDLWASVVWDAAPDRCDVCGDASATVTFEVLAETVEAVMGEVWVSVEESGAYHDDGRWSERVEDVAVLVEELLAGAVGDQALAPLVDFVAGRNAVDYGFVRRRDVWGTLYDLDEGAWRTFMDRAGTGDIETATREVLAALPDDVLSLFERIEQVALVAGLFRQSSPALWRCRKGTREDGHRTVSRLGSAPAQYAADGRLNMRRQSVFYGSTTLRGAVIEMRHHHGEDVELWAGRFSTSRPLYYLDVLETPAFPSPFAPGAADTDDAIRFLDRFATTIRQRRTDNPRHYLPTQIFVSFLLTAHEEVQPDAIRYASSLDATVENWVVFADHEHCVDLRADVRADMDRVVLRLDTKTVRHLSAAAALSLRRLPVRTPRSSRPDPCDAMPQSGGSADVAAGAAILGSACALNLPPRGPPAAADLRHDGP